MSFCHGGGLALPDQPGHFQSAEGIPDILQIIGNISRIDKTVFDGRLEGKLGFFDADVKEPVSFSNATDLGHIKPKGGGGTDFRPIFTYVRDNYRNEYPACIVIFTDGYAPYPNESDALGIPVLWLINNEDMTPPFGKVARILSEGKGS